MVGRDLAVGAVIVMKKCVLYRIDEVVLLVLEATGAGE